MEENHKIILGLLNQQHQAPKVKYPRPQPFSGDNHSQEKVEILLREVDYYFTANAIPENFHQRLLYFNGLLDEKGSAKRWVAPLLQQIKNLAQDQLPQYLNSWNSFSAEFSKEFSNRFGDPLDDLNAQHQFNTISQRTSLHDYSVRFYSLLAPLYNVHPDVAMRTYFVGLKLAIKVHLASSQYRTLDELEDQAHQIDTNLQAQKPLLRNTNYPVRPYHYSLLETLPSNLLQSPHPMCQWT